MTRHLHRVATLLIAAGASAHIACAALPAEARQVVVQARDNGYVWQTVTVPMPTPGAREVLLEVHAVALNRGDLEDLEGGMKAEDVGLIPCSDAAGEVVAVGPGVKDVRLGERVTTMYLEDWNDGPPNRARLSRHLAGTSPDKVNGVLGEYVLVRETALVRAPQGLSWEEAATLPTAGLTGWSATLGTHAVKPGEIVLVQGSGGVAVFAAQFAHAAGARVLATSSSDEKIARLLKFGVSDAINYRTFPKWSAEVKRLTDEHGADLIVDLGGKQTLEESTRALAFAGQLSMVGGLTGYDGSIPAGAIIGRAARVQGIFVGSRAEFARMSAFIVKQRMKPVIDRVYRFDEYPAALEQMRKNDFVGKIVISLEH